MKNIDIILWEGTNLFNVPSWRNAIKVLETQYKVNTKYSGKADLYLTVASPRPIGTTRKFSEIHDAPIMARVIGDNFKVQRQVRNPLSFMRLVYRTRAAFRLVDFFSPVSSVSDSYLRRAGVPDYKILEPVPFPIDADQFVPEPRPSKFSVGMISRNSPEKGAKIFKKLAEINKAIPFHIAGKGWENEQLPSNCTKHGWLEGKDLLDFYNLIHVLIVPSFSETLGYVTLEALLMGVPVISTKAARPYPINRIYPYCRAESVSNFVDSINDLHRLGTWLPDYREDIKELFGMETAGKRLLEQVEEVIG